MLTSVEERIREIEDEIRRTPYNKATQKHIGRLKARLARLRESTSRQRGGGRAGDVRKSGDATVALVGFPSVGKSTLLNQITEASSKVSNYDFTTLRAVPGVLNHKGARIQILDLPGLTRGASRGRGRGREILSMVRIADLLLLMIDVERSDLQTLVQELHRSGIRVNENPPRLSLHKRDRGGIDISFAVQPQEMEEETIREMLREWGVINAELVVMESLTPDRLVDFLVGNRAYVPGIVVLNKIDLLPEGEVSMSFGNWTVIHISAMKGEGLERLLEVVYSRLSLIRVYLRPPGKKRSTGEPLVVRRGAKVHDICNLVHGEMAERFKHARIWGPSAKFSGQTVGMEHRVEEGDTITIVTRRG